MYLTIFGGVECSDS